MIKLVVRQKDSVECREYTLDREQILAGRLESSAIPLDGERVSRRHLTIQKLESGQYQAVDNSANGTLINGQPLPKGQPRILAEGDELQIGKHILTISFPSSMPDFGELDRRLKTAISLSPPDASTATISGVPSGPGSTPLEPLNLTRRVDREVLPTTVQTPAQPAPSPEPSTFAPVPSPPPPPPSFLGSAISPPPSEPWRYQDWTPPAQPGPLERFRERLHDLLVRFHYPAIGLAALAAVLLIVLLFCRLNR